MDSSFTESIGFWICRVLDETGFQPSSCGDIENRGTIGLVGFAIFFIAAVVIGWRRFL